MVKKLLKHELIYYARIFVLFIPIVLVISAVTRFFFGFESENYLVRIAFGGSVLMLFMACFALMILSTVVSVVRFYKNMYSSEGYLTFALPVTNAQHIFVKLLGSVICSAACLLTVVLSVIIVLSGEPLAQLFAELKEELSFIFPGAQAIHLVLLTVEFLIVTVLGSVLNTLLYYACITVGQTAKKNRILLAVGAYFIYYIATQIVTTVITIIVTVLSITGLFNNLIEWATNHVVAISHIYLLAIIIIASVMSAAFWLVTQWIMTKKLNLE